MRVLIIEDNSAFAGSLKELLSCEGWDVTALPSYEEAKPVLNAGPYDVWIIDVLLPQTGGFEILNAIKDQPFIQDAMIILVSGIFSIKAMEEKIPPSLKQQIICMKKPIDQKLLMEKMTVFIQNKTFTVTQIEDDTGSPRPFNIPKNKTFHGGQWVKILFKAHRSRFEGELTVRINNGRSEGETVRIDLKEGNIIRVSSNHKESYFGALLVKHGFSIEKEIQKNLTEEGSESPLGQRLIQSGRLSPHIVHVILKEQIKIRMSQLVSDLSFRVNVQPKPIAITADSVAFGEWDLIEWAIDCIKTKFADSWLKSFFDKNKDSFIYPIKAVTSHPGHPFIKKYRALFDGIPPNTVLSDIVRKFHSDERLTKKTKNENYRSALEMVYFGIITKSMRIRTVEKNLKKSKKLEQLADTILQTDSNDLFQTLSLPEHSSPPEVEAGYKKMAKILHPDKYPPGVSTELKEKCQKAFVRITESYEILRDEKKRMKYLKQADNNLFINMISVYEKGLAALQIGDYKSAVRLFSKIQGKPKSPGNTLIYMIWAQIKADPQAMKNKTHAGNIKKRINSIPIEDRCSYMFWFINGLYFSYTGNYDQSLPLFHKALQIKGSFREAGVEYRRAKTFRDRAKAEQAKNKGIFSKIFKTG